MSMVVVKHGVDIVVDVNWLFAGKFMGDTGALSGIGGKIIGQIMILSMKVC